MTFLTILDMLNYVLVLIFGLFLSVHIAGGYTHPKERRLFCVLCVVLLAVQGGCYFLWGVDFAQQLYPVVIHLPLTLVLIFALRKSVGVALGGVCTAYLCCQIPRWVGLAALAITHAPLAEEICYTVSIVPTFYLLRRYFAPAAHSAMTYSRQTLALFGSLPLAYYLFDYATTVYADSFYMEAQALYEFLPTALIVFYVLFLTMYHAESRNKAQAELQKTVLEKELKQFHTEMEQMRRSAHQTAVYHHDMRHHLQLISSFLSSGKNTEAMAYIHRIQEEVDSVQPRRFCQHEAVNLLCSSFTEKAQRMEVELTVDASLPQDADIPDTELCSLLSNGLENALHAAAQQEQGRRWVRLYCTERSGNLLLEIRNPYTGTITLRDGIPTSDRPEHGYGCLSIAAIAQRRRGHCQFLTEEGIFTLRVAIPL